MAELSKRRQPLRRGAEFPARPGQDPVQEGRLLHGDAGVGHGPQRPRCVETLLNGSKMKKVFDCKK